MLVKLPFEMLKNPPALMGARVSSRWRKNSSSYLCKRSVVFLNSSWILLFNV